MVDASKEIVLMSWQTQRFAGSRAKEWPAWRSLNEQGLCYGVGESPEISRWIVRPKKNVQRAELGVQLALGNANLRGGKMARDRRGFGNGRRGQVL